MSITQCRAMPLTPTLSRKSGAREKKPPSGPRKERVPE